MHVQCTLHAGGRARGCYSQNFQCYGHLADTCCWHHTTDITSARSFSCCSVLSMFFLLIIFLFFPVIALAAAAAALCAKRCLGKALGGAVRRAISTVVSSVADWVAPRVGSGPPASLHGATCDACRSQLTRAVQLPCGHLHCASCLRQKLLADASATSQRQRCPACHATITALMPNFSDQEIAELRALEPASPAPGLGRPEMAAAHMQRHASDADNAARTDWGWIQHMNAQLMAQTQRVQIQQRLRQCPGMMWRLGKDVHTWSAVLRSDAGDELLANTMTMSISKLLHSAGVPVHGAAAWLAGMVLGPVLLVPCVPLALAEAYVATVRQRTAAGLLPLQS